MSEETFIYKMVGTWAYYWCCDCRQKLNKLNIHFPLCLRIHMFDNATNLGPLDKDNEAMAEEVSGEVGMVIWQMSDHQMM